MIVRIGRCSDGCRQGIAYLRLDPTKPGQAGAGCRDDPGIRQDSVVPGGVAVVTRQDVGQLALATQALADVFFAGVGVAVAVVVCEQAICPRIRSPAELRYATTIGAEYDLDDSLCHVCNLPGKMIPYGIYQRNSQTIKFFSIKFWIYNKISIIVNILIVNIAHNGYFHL